MVGEGTSLLMRSGFGRAVSPYEAESLALFARFTTPADDTRKGHIDTLYATLKSAGILARLDCLYLTAAADAQAAQRNLIADARNLTPVNTPTFTADRGYSGDGVSQHLTWGTTWVDGGAAQYVQDDACMFWWENTNVALDTYALADTNTNARTVGRGRSVTTDLMFVRVNSSTGITDVQASSVGFSFGQRTSSVAIEMWRNAVKEATSGASTSTSTGLADTVAFLRQGTSYSTRRVAAGGKGRSLTQGQIPALYNALNTYLTAVGGA